MALFFKKKKETAEPVKEERPKKIGHKYVFQQSGGFRGYKSYGLNTGNSTKAQEDIRSIAYPNPKYGKIESAGVFLYRTKEEPIVLQEEYYGPRFTELRIGAYVNQYQVGVMFIHEENEKSMHFYDILKNKKIEAAHIWIEYSKEFDRFSSYIMIKEKRS